MALAPIETIERSTLAAVSPEAVHELPGWLLPFDHGTVGRAKSAVPLQHTADFANPALIHPIAQHYTQRGLRPSFRLPDVPCFDAFRAELQRLGYRPEQPTLVQLGSVQAMQGVTSLPSAEVATSPDAGWELVFLGEGFDPVDGASRVKTLRKAPGSVFASVREGSKTIAAGAGAFSHGWASVHGMRTDQAHRGKGLAARVLVGLAGAAAQRGLNDVFLQVEQANSAALALYKRAGFSTAWMYKYWRLPVAKGCVADGC